MKHYIAYFLFTIAKRLSPKVWSAIVTSATNNVAMTVSMAYLDRMGVKHCNSCAQTIDLTGNDSFLLCHQHKTESNSSYNGWILK